jgi:hypothetical protein
VIRYAQTAPPGTEPVTLAEAKAFARIEHSADDDLLTGFITIARRAIEQITHRALITQTWTATMDRLPAIKYEGDPDPWPFGNATTPRAIQLSPLPVASITSLVIDGATIASTNYRLKGDTLAIKTTVNDSTDELGDAIVVTFVAGYGAAAAVPPEIVQAIKTLVSHLYENRELATPSWQTATPIPFGVSDMVRPFIVMRGP